MAEPLKYQFGADVPVRIGRMLASVDPYFDVGGFVAEALEGYDELELTARARQIARSLRRFLPDELPAALDLIVRSLGPEIVESELTGMEGFLYLPFVFFVAEFGLGDLEPSLRAQYELTKRFTAEFSIRPFLVRYPHETLARLRRWATDPNVHVRRLVSEGTRPRLPWAPRLSIFIDDPEPVIALLELLKDDPEEYVRRSVANNLNDIAKDHPERVVSVAAAWWDGASPARRRLIQHGLRSLVKQGHPEALAVLGFGRGSPLSTRATIEPTHVQIGGRVSVVVTVHNPTPDALRAVIDLRVHFVKADGSERPKVFKGAELSVGPGRVESFRRSISVAQHTTRTHYPGSHRVELLVNGEARRGGHFELI